MDAHADALTLRVARVLAPVTVLGPGRRVAVWVQGCALACPGCASRDTWDAAAGTLVPVTALADRLADAVAADGLDGLTLTGGEPTDQAAALTALVVALRERRPGLDVLLFTGRELSAARALAPGLVAASTCVVAGPYRRDRATPGHRLLATANQELRIAPEASGRYEDWLAEPEPPRLQVFAEGDGLYLVGLPAPGDLDRFRRELGERGVELEGVSW
nr:radical SAM protein [Propionibacterium sp.]